MALIPAVHPDRSVAAGAAWPADGADLERYERTLARYLAGELEEDVFRIFRLNFGIYGQRQGGRNQMVRVKLPAGVVSPEQLRTLGRVADRYSRGWGHITTRQNIQFHFVDLERTPELLGELGSVGLTTREACGDTVRNVAACPLAGACPAEILDVSPWADATFRTFLRHPYGQRLPRKFKVNFSGCARDCGQAAFNDVGVIAATRAHDNGTVEKGFRVLIGGGLGASPHAAHSLESFTSRHDLLATIEAVLRTFDHYGNRENKLRARMKWLVDTVGIDQLRDRIRRERTLLFASATYPEGLPPEVLDRGDGAWGDDHPPADPGRGPDPGPLGGGAPVTLSGSDPFARWRRSNVIGDGTGPGLSAVVHVRLGDVTARQFAGLARIVGDLGLEARVTNRQNVVLRGLRADQLRSLHGALGALGLAKPGAGVARDVVSCPGADTCSMAVTQSRGLAAAVEGALESAGLAEVGGVRINISGCANSCGQHHVADIGLMGAERRAHGRAAPGYQLFLGGHLDERGVVFGRKALRVPAKAAADATVEVVGRFASERLPGESFAGWLERIGGAGTVAAGLSQMAEFPSPDDAPDFYVDFGETGPYAAEVGAGECAES